jgi:hypothetical protein
MSVVGCADRMLVWHVTVVGFLIAGAASHGRLEEPAARNCAWRFGYKTPANYNDNELNCGGVGQQWTTNGTKNQSDKFNFSPLSRIE